MIRHTLPFRLILDVQAIQSEMHPERGIARFTAQHARALLDYEGLVAHLSLNPCRPFPKNPDPALAYSGLLTWGSLPLIHAAVERGPAVYYAMSPIERCPLDALHPRSPVGTHAHFAVTLYDLIPLLFPDRYLREATVRARYKTRLELVKSADLVCAISESTRGDAIRELHLDPEKVHVIGGGVSRFFRPSFTQREDARLVSSMRPALNGQFIFTVLGEEWRKNVDRLVQAYMALPRRLRNQYQLVIGGQYSEWAIQKIKSVLGNVDAGRVVFTGCMDDELLRALYRTCSLFVFPSLYEGFGLPVAEAACCGARVITSNTSSLPEVLDSPLTTFDPYSVGAIAGAIERALTDRKHASELRRIALARAGGLGWDKVAARTVKALASLAPRKRLVPARRRLAVGLAGPFPPVRSGIADYNYYMARELAKLVDLFVFYTDGSDGNGLRAIGAAGWRPVSELGSRFTPAYLDQMIYTLGNSEHHVETYEAALAFPGLAWLHDVRLAGFYHEYCREKEPAAAGQFFLRETARMYPHRVPPHFSGGGPFDLRAARDWGLGYTRDIVRSSRGLILNSAFALQLLQLDQGPGGRLPPALVLPLACHAPAHYAELGAGNPGGCPIIVSTGLVDWIKAPDLLIDAFSRVKSIRDCRLVFVGTAPHELRKELLEQARASGVADAVSFTGFVTEEEYFRWILRSRCVVQLRRATNGESSAAVLSCMGAGVPVITNVGACREMPEDSREFVPMDVTSEELQQRIVTLLCDDAAWKRLHRGSLRYAWENTFARVSERIAGTLEEGFASRQGGSPPPETDTLPQTLATML